MPSHTVLSNWRCLSEFAAHNKAKQTSLCWAAHTESGERANVCCGWLNEAGEPGLTTCELLAKSCCAIMIPKRLTHTTNSESLSLTHSLVRTLIVITLYISLHLFWFLCCRRRSKLKLLRAKRERDFSRRGELNATLSGLSGASSSVWLRPLQRQVQCTELFVRHRRRWSPSLIRLRRFQLLLLCTPNANVAVVIVRVVVDSFVVPTGKKKKRKKVKFVGRYRLKGGKLKANKVLFCLHIRRKIQVNPFNYYYALFKYCFNY